MAKNALVSQRLRQCRSRQKSCIITSSRVFGFGIAAILLTILFSTFLFTTSTTQQEHSRSVGWACEMSVVHHREEDLPQSFANNNDNSLRFFKIAQQLLNRVVVSANAQKIVYNLCPVQEISSGTGITLQFPTDHKLVGNNCKINAYLKITFDENEERYARLPTSLYPATDGEDADDTVLLSPIPENNSDFTGDAAVIAVSAEVHITGGTVEDGSDKLIEFILHSSMEAAKASGRIFITVKNVVFGANTALAFLGSLPPQSRIVISGNTFKNTVGPNALFGTNARFAAVYFQGEWQLLERSMILIENNEVKHLGGGGPYFSGVSTDIQSIYFFLFNLEGKVPGLIIDGGSSFVIRSNTIRETYMGVKAWRLLTAQTITRGAIFCFFFSLRDTGSFVVSRYSSFIFESNALIDSITSVKEQQASNFLGDSGAVLFYMGIDFGTTKFPLDQQIVRIQISQNSQVSTSKNVIRRSLGANFRVIYFFSNLRNRNATDFDGIKRYCAISGNSSFHMDDNIVSGGDPSPSAIQRMLTSFGGSTVSDLVHSAPAYLYEVEVALVFLASVFILHDHSTFSMSGNGLYSIGSRREMLQTLTKTTDGKLVASIAGKPSSAVDVYDDAVDGVVGLLEVAGGPSASIKAARFSPAMNVTIAGNSRAIFANNFMNQFYSHHHCEVTAAFVTPFVSFTTVCGHLTIVNGSQLVFEQNHIVDLFTGTHSQLGGLDDASYRNGTSRKQNETAEAGVVGAYLRVGLLLSDASPLCINPAFTLPNATTVPYAPLRRWWLEFVASFVPTSSLSYHDSNFILTNGSSMVVRDNSMERVVAFQIQLVSLSLCSSSFVVGSSNRGKGSTAVKNSKAPSRPSSIHVSENFIANSEATSSQMSCIGMGFSRLPLFWLDGNASVFNVSSNFITGGNRSWFRGSSTQSRLARSATIRPLLSGLSPQEQARYPKEGYVYAPHSEGPILVVSIHLDVSGSAAGGPKPTTIRGTNSLLITHGAALLIQQNGLFDMVIFKPLPGSNISSYFPNSTFGLDAYAVGQSLASHYKATQRLLTASASHGLPATSRNQIFAVALTISADYFICRGFNAEERAAVIAANPGMDDDATAFPDTGLLVNDNRLAFVYGAARSARAVNAVITINGSARASGYNAYLPTVADNTLEQVMLIGVPSFANVLGELGVNPLAYDSVLAVAGAVSWILQVSALITLNPQRRLHFEADADDAEESASDTVLTYAHSLTAGAKTLFFRNIVSRFTLLMANSSYFGNRSDVKVFGVDYRLKSGGGFAMVTETLSDYAVSSVELTQNALIDVTLVEEERYHGPLLASLPASPALLNPLMRRSATADMHSPYTSEARRLFFVAAFAFDGSLKESNADAIQELIDSSSAIFLFSGEGNFLECASNEMDGLRWEVLNVSGPYFGANPSDPFSAVLGGSPVPSDRALAVSSAAWAKDLYLALIIRVATVYIESLSVSLISAYLHLDFNRLVMDETDTSRSMVRGGRWSMFTATEPPSPSSSTSSSSPNFLVSYNASVSFVVVDLVVGPACESFEAIDSSSLSFSFIAAEVKVHESGIGLGAVSNPSQSETTKKAQRAAGVGVSTTVGEHQSRLASVGSHHVVRIHFEVEDGFSDVGSTTSGLSNLTHASKARLGQILLSDMALMAISTEVSIAIHRKVNSPVSGSVEGSWPALTLSSTAQSLFFPLTVFAATCSFKVGTGAMLSAEDNVGSVAQVPIDDSTGQPLRTHHKALPASTSEAAAAAYVLAEPERSRHYGRQAQVLFGIRFLRPVELFDDGGSVGYFSISTNTLTLTGHQQCPPVFLDVARVFSPSSPQPNGNSFAVQSNDITLDTSAAAEGVAVRRNGGEGALAIDLLSPSCPCMFINATDGIRSIDIKANSVQANATVYIAVGSLRTRTQGTLEVKTNRFVFGPARMPVPPSASSLAYIFTVQMPSHTLLWVQGQWVMDARSVFRQQGNTLDIGRSFGAVTALPPRQFLVYVPSTSNEIQPWASPQSSSPFYNRTGRFSFATGSTAALVDVCGNTLYGRLREDPLNVLPPELAIAPQAKQCVAPTLTIALTSASLISTLSLSPQQSLTHALSQSRMPTLASHTAFSDSAEMSPTVSSAPSVSRGEPTPEASASHTNNSVDVPPRRTTPSATAQSLIVSQSSKMSILGASPSAPHVGASRSLLVDAAVITTTPSVAAPFTKPPETWLQVVKAAAERGSASVMVVGGAVLSPKAGGQAGVAMAVLRISQLCQAEEDSGDLLATADNTQNDLNIRGRGRSEGDDDGDNLDEPLSPFIHPLSLALGTGPYRYFIGAVIGNCLVIPLAFYIALRGPLYHVLKRWLLPGDPSHEDVFHFMGWPSVLALPLSVLAEGTMTAVVELLRSGSSVESLVGIVGLLALATVIGAWAYVLYRLYRLPIVLQRAPFEGSVFGWPFAPLWERGPAPGAKPDITRDVESMLERMAHFFGDGVMLWAELGCIVCSLIVGGIEGAARVLPCRESTPVLLAFALLQSILSCMTMVPGEFAVQLLIAVCLALLSVSAVLDAYGSKQFLSDEQQEALALAINILSFFGVAVGLLIALLKLLRSREAAALLLRARGIKDIFLSRFAARRLVSIEKKRKMCVHASPLSFDTERHLLGEAGVAVEMDNVDLHVVPFLDEDSQKEDKDEEEESPIDQFLRSLQEAVAEQQERRLADTALLGTTVTSNEKMIRRPNDASARRGGEKEQDNEVSNAPKRRANKRIALTRRSAKKEREKGRDNSRRPLLLIENSDDDDDDFRLLPPPGISSQNTASLQSAGSHITFSAQVVSSPVASADPTDPAGVAVPRVLSVPTPTATRNNFPSREANGTDQVLLLSLSGNEHSSSDTSSRMSVAVLASAAADDLSVSD